MLMILGLVLCHITRLQDATLKHGGVGSYRYGSFIRKGVLLGYVGRIKT